jgi:hypothetical protein
LPNQLFDALGNALQFGNFRFQRPLAFVQLLDLALKDRALIALNGAHVQFIKRASHLPQFHQRGPKPGLGVGEHTL